MYQKILNFDIFLHENFHFLPWSFDSQIGQNVSRGFFILHAPQIFGFIFWYLKHHNFNAQKIPFNGVLIFFRNFFLKVQGVIFHLMYIRSYLEAMIFLGKNSATGWTRCATQGTYDIKRDYVWNFHTSSTTKNHEHQVPSKCSTSPSI